MSLPGPQALPSRSSRIETGALWLLVALCVVRFWLMPLPASFWVDESVTAFVVNHPRDPSFAIAPQVPLSIYYQFPRWSAALFGSSEVAYRLPSLLMMAVALFVIARLAARLIHPDAAWFVVLACFSLRGLNFEAIDARPYALGILVASASLLLMVRWLDRARWIDALGFVAAAALLWRVQLVFWPFYAIYGIYAAVRLVKRETQVRLLSVLAVFFAVGLFLLPVAGEALSLFNQAGAHVIAKLPTWRDLQHGLEFYFVVLCPIAAWLLRRLLRQQAEPAKWAFSELRSRIVDNRSFASRARQQAVWRHVIELLNVNTKWSVSSLCLCLCWWLVVPVTIFAFSWITGNSVFVPRYYSEATPGVAFAAAALSALFLPARWWKPVTIGFGIGVLFFVGDWTVLWPPHSPSLWREASQAIRAAGAQEGTPVICPSPFIEAQSPVWYPNYPMPDFLSCHLLRYPFPGKKYLFPFVSSPDAEEFAGELMESKLVPARRFFLYGGEINVRYWHNWFACQPQLAGWSHHSLGKFGDVQAIVFAAP